VDDIQALKSRFPRSGRLEWIGVRSQRRGPVRVVRETTADVETGLAGDHYGPGTGGSRQVTLVHAEHLPAVAHLCGLEDLSPELLRRNLVVSGVNLLALEGMRFRIGAAVLAGTGLCRPCQRMEEVLGAGGYNAMCGRGGLTARVIQSGRLQVGDPVEVIGPVED